MDSPTTSAADLAERLVGAPLQPSSGPLFLSSPRQQSHAFLLLSAASLAIGVAALSSPELMLSVLSGDSPTALELALFKVAGATMLMNAAVSYSLQGDAAAGRLKSSTCQRLLLANMAKDVMLVMAMGLSPELWSPALASWYLAPAGASLIITGASLRSALQQSGAVSTIAGIKNALGGWRQPKTAAGWGYSVLTVVYVAAAAACYAPEVLFTGAAATPVSQLMKHTWVPGILLAGAGCWAMADAADKGKDAVAASTFRTLNLGVIATEVAFLPVLGLCMKTGLVVNNFLSWGVLASPVVISLYCLYQHQACYSAGDDNAN